ncbi:hypothetical protein QTP70_022582, partial [Hemibagrus guttatus]
MIQDLKLKTYNCIMTSGFILISSQEVFPHHRHLWLALNVINHSSSTAYLIYSRVTGSLCLSQASLGIKAGYTLELSANPSQGTHTLSFTHTITHYGQFRDANQPTRHVFGL